MARSRASPLIHVFTGMLLATLLLPEILLAGPVIQRLKGDDAPNEKTAVEAGSTRLIRNRRNISWYKQHSDFWSWYKYFTDNGNQDGVAELDRVYLAYLQNKNRAESRRSYKQYLHHLADIYKSCSETDDPNCVASYTSRSKPKAEAPAPAPVKSCDPYRDPYCLYPKGYTYYPYLVPAQAPAPAPVKAPAPAPVKGPAYLSTPVKDPRSGQYYYSSLLQPFLSAEQRAELMRICDAEDVECLQYHLRAAYGYRPAAAVAPSYAHQKGPSSLYTPYPYCDPRVDPYCAYASAFASSQNPEAPSSPSALERPCNPLYDDSCNPLTATRFASLSYKEPKDEPASEAGAMRVPPSSRHDPYAMYRDASAGADMRRRLPTHLQPPRHQPEESQHPLGPRGKTKEGYDCFIGYDEECFPAGSQNEPRTGAQRPASHPSEAYEPHLNADGTRNGVVEPDPDCDPEYDRNCRLRRYEPEVAQPASPSPLDEYQVAQPTEEHSNEEGHHEVPQHREESYPETPGYDQQQYDPYMSGQEDPYAGYGPQESGVPSIQDVLRGYGGRYPGQDDHRAYTGDYKKK